MSTQPDGADAAGARTGRLVQNVMALLRLRFLQAQRDTKDAVRSLAMGVVLGLIALVVVLLAMPLLVAAVILALAQYLPAWLAAASILLTMLIAAAVLVVLARRRLRWLGPSIAADLRADWQAIRRHLEEPP